MTDKLCSTCVFEDMPATTTVCATCTRGGVAEAPHWKAKRSRIDIIGQNGNEGLHYVESAWQNKHEGLPKIEKSDGSTANYYTLPEGAKELQDLISYRDMNAQIGEVFRACYRYGLASHSDRLRDARKIKFYAEAEIARLEKLGYPSRGWQEVMS